MKRNAREGKKKHAGQFQQANRFGPIEVRSRCFSGRSPREFRVSRERGETLMKVTESNRHRMSCFGFHSLKRRQRAFASCLFEKLDAAFLITERGPNSLGRVSTSIQPLPRNNFFSVKLRQLRSDSIVAEFRDSKKEHGVSVRRWIS